MAVDAARQLKAILWMRWKTRLRAGKWALILMALLLIPTALAMGAGVLWMLLHLRLATALTLLKVGLFFLWLAWALAPVIGVSINESWDVSRLFVYPISLARVFAAAVLGALTDISSLTLAPTILAIIVGAFFWSPGAGAVAALAIPLLLFQTIALSQTGVLLLAGALKSRKFRDIALIIVPLFWMSLQLFRYALPQNVERQALKSPLWGAFDWLTPPGMAVRAIAEAERGSYGIALAALALLALICAATVAVAARLLARVYDGEEVHLQSGRARERRDESQTGPSRAERLLTLLPTETAALVQKEWRYFARDPYYRLAAMNLFYGLAFAAASVLLRSGRRGGSAGEWMSLPWAGVALVGGALSIALLSQAALVGNLFGVDAGGASQLFSFPTQRRRFFLGKNLALASVLTPLNLLLALGASLLARRPDLALPAGALVLLLMPLLFGAGNIFSVFFAFRIAYKGARIAQSGTSFGCLGSLLWLGLSLLSMCLYAPAVAAVLVPLFVVERAWLALTLPLAALYAAGMYTICLRAAEGFLLQREPQIAEAVRRPSE